MRQKVKRSEQARAIVQSGQPEAAFFMGTTPIQRSLKLDFQHVTQYKFVQGANIVTSTSTATFRSFSFKFSDTQDVAEMSAVFDQYKIANIDYKIMPDVTIADSSTKVLGLNQCVIDYDDANLFTSITDPADYTNLRVSGPLEAIQGSFVPHFAYAAYATGVFTSFANSPPRWIDAASPGVEHYGLKLAFGTTSTVITYTVTFRYKMVYRMAH